MPEGVRDPSSHRTPAQIRKQVREHELDEDGVIVHNSMDGREQFETGERKMS